jgi:hypothetical protein
MPNEKRKWTIEAEQERKTESLLKPHYPWNPRATLSITESGSTAVPKKATAQYQALLQNRETD